ncbi:nodulation protein NodH [Celeribacter sp.]|uniref:nodulation protein NodH n=1 Tax=Celeribacter sp. TaxID=1890673 RepID=UPI003A8EEFA9
MSDSFDYFVILAEMRTGSNFLEENVNSYPGLKCWGEVFNPAFIGKARKNELLGVSIADRERDPNGLLDKLIAETDGLAGFRFFHDHDPRILDRVLKDRTCAKIILTRNPLESYVSRKIAGATGQWRLGDLKDARSAQVRFDKAEFTEMLDEVKAFQIHLQRRLQTSGQTAFYINYEDIQDIEVVNGLARYLGVTEERNKTNTKTKVQNPSSLKDKVVNYDEMVADLASVDHFNLSNTPNFEPRRGPAVPTYVAAADAPLLYQPVRSGPTKVVKAWMAALDGVGVEDLRSGFTQKSLRNWKRNAKQHRSFTVISHPVVRLHRAFCRHILSTGPECYNEIRETLRTTYSLPIPAGEVTADNYSKAQHRAAFIGFAGFIKGNLNGQTSIRVDGAWASQSEVIKGFAEFSLPDMVLREETLVRDLAWLAEAARVKKAPAPESLSADQPFALNDIYDNDVEKAVKAAYQRDYMIFGLKPYA